MSVPTEEETNLESLALLSLSSPWGDKCGSCSRALQSLVLGVVAIRVFMLQRAFACKSSCSTCPPMCPLPRWEGVLVCQLQLICRIQTPEHRGGQRTHHSGRSHRNPSGRAQAGWSRGSQGTQTNGKWVKTTDPHVPNRCCFSWSHRGWGLDSEQSNQDGEDLLYRKQRPIPNLHFPEGSGQDSVQRWPGFCLYLILDISTHISIWDCA